MELTLNRKIKDNITSIGEMLIDGVFDCFTLEDKDRGLTQFMQLSEVEKLKVQNETAIPTGRYEVAINYSNRFKRLMPILLNVPDYAGVRIHWGNYCKDTDGCILLGTTKDKDFIGHSVDAFNAFMEKLTEALKTEKVFITIK